MPSLPTTGSSAGTSCTTLLSVAGSFFVLGFIFQILLLKELHLQNAELGIVTNIENHLPFHLRSDGRFADGGLLIRPEKTVHHKETAADVGAGDSVPAAPVLEQPALLAPASERNITHTEVPAASSLQKAPPRPMTGGGESNSSSSRRYYRDIIGELPELVKSWRNAQLDWHDLLPKHMSTWERFGEKKGLRLLVSKEEQITDYLTRFTESGLADGYGHDHGPLLAYSGCNKLRSDCMIHSQSVCETNGLCMWNSEKELCVDFEIGSPYGVQKPGAPHNGRVQQCGAKGNKGMPTDRGVAKVKSRETGCKVSNVIRALGSETNTVNCYVLSCFVCCPALHGPGPCCGGCHGRGNGLDVGGSAGSGHRAGRRVTVDVLSLVCHFNSIDERLCCR